MLENEGEVFLGSWHMPCFLCMESLPPSGFSEGGTDPSTAGRSELQTQDSSDVSGT